MVSISGESVKSLKLRKSRLKSDHCLRVTHIVDRCYALSISPLNYECSIGYSIQLPLSPIPLLLLKHCLLSFLTSSSGMRITKPPASLLLLYTPVIPFIVLSHYTPMVHGSYILAVNLKSVPTSKLFTFCYYD